MVRKVKSYRYSLVKGNKAEVVELDKLCQEAHY